MKNVFVVMMLFCCAAPVYACSDYDLGFADGIRTYEIDADSITFYHSEIDKQNKTLDEAKKIWAQQVASAKLMETQWNALSREQKCALINGYQPFWKRTDGTLPITLFGPNN